LGIYAQIVDAAAQATNAGANAGAGVYKKAERAAKSNLQAARYELQASQAGAGAASRVAQIAAESTVEAAQLRIAAAKIAREKTQKSTQKVLFIGGSAVVVLGLGVLLAFGGKSTP
jgi:multidrug efflux pump subunit AcrA (membrane-fusion protein)